MTRPSGSNAGAPLIALVRIALWFGIVAGLIKGLGLLAFQHINWQGWGPMIHVSVPIIWIFPNC